jgi:hypothetical protein
MPPAQRLARRVADVEAPVAVGRVGTPFAPGEQPPALVPGVEAHREECVEEPEHARAVVAPRPRRLVMRALGADGDCPDRGGWRKLAGDPDRIANEVLPDARTGWTPPDLHLRDPVSCVVRAISWLPHLL